jgi:hypothetical protein
MLSALELVAFAQGCETTGTLALLEVARKALNRTGNRLAAAHLDLAIIKVSEALGDGRTGGSRARH